MSPHETDRSADIPDTALERVRSHLDVARTVTRMLDDLQRHPGEWENHTLERFLEALAAYLEARRDVDLRS